MVTLKSWYSIHAKRPLMVLVLTIVLVQFVYLYFLKNENDKKFSELANALATTTSVSLAQKNRVMLENLLTIALAVPEFISFNLCQGQNSVLAYPTDSEACFSSKVGPFEMVEYRDIKGFLGFRLALVRRTINFSFSTIFSMTLTLVFSLFSAILVFFISRRFETDILLPISSDFDLDSGNGITELIALKKRIARLVKLESEKAEVQIARQVAHDIRSPLSALNALIKGRRFELPASDLNLIERVYERINAIADSLMKKGGSVIGRDEAVVEFSSFTAKCSTSEICSICETVVAEKKARFEHLAITVDIGVGLVDSKSGVTVDIHDCGRIVSNILNNSIEAGDGLPKIFLSIEQEGQELVLRVRDNGFGMSAEALWAVRNSGGTFGKKDGRGLGLSHLRQVVSEAGGRWLINSWPSRGTTVEIRLPILV